jgi:hypothetical protein
MAGSPTFGSAPAQLRKSEPQSAGKNWSQPFGTEPAGCSSIWV